MPGIWISVSQRTPAANPSSSALRPACLRHVCASCSRCQAAQLALLPMHEFLPASAARTGPRTACMLPKLPAAPFTGMPDACVGEPLALPGRAARSAAAGRDGWIGGRPGWAGGAAAPAGKTQHCLSSLPAQWRSSMRKPSFLISRCWLTTSADLWLAGQCKAQQ